MGSARSTRCVFWQQASAWPAKRLVCRQKLPQSLCTGWSQVVILATHTSFCINRRATYTLTWKVTGSARMVCDVFISTFRSRTLTVVLAQSPFRSSLAPGHDRDKWQWDKKVFKVLVIDLPLKPQDTDLNYHQTCTLNMQWTRTIISYP